MAESNLIDEQYSRMAQYVEVMAKALDATTKLTWIKKEIFELGRSINDSQLFCESARSSLLVES